MVSPLRQSGVGQNGAFGGGGGGGGGATGSSSFGGNGGIGGFGGGGGSAGSGRVAGGNGGSGGAFGGRGGDGRGNNAGGTTGGGGAGLGGAIFNDGGSLNLTNTTLTGNSTQGGTSNSFGGGASGQAVGGAVFSRNGALTVLSSTISSNTAVNGGRGIYVLGDAAVAMATLDNTLIGQSDTSVSDFVASTISSGSTTTSGTGNLIRTQTGFSGTIVSTADPLLSVLGSYGGTTQNLALLPGSPAINAGTASGSPTKD